ncbi:uncharacterized protein MELLADRAFT_69185 [Melampsora larici-populina 98AG31]|uniref:Uncharacterized protein n=1 Tax=Melampsora larici-populina (strain 98AG31 / pathotype 3-4-7) TaxID=747676 RepID=F4S9P8_MELLP|nr:uncharacterized protein MELLADRAFT_69185 [Melampsora larici-populina 98AG31]EGF98631.1 hypothetical protein MELLADRAFT_69185 [Melampsora larici-populina 98AG31]
MSASSKKTKEAHRVVCRCKARECYLGNYIDAYGQPQSGVEVLPSTRDAHTRADMRKQALEASSELASSPNTHIPTPGDLVTSLEELHLPSVNMPSQSRKSAREQPLPTSTTELRTSIRGPLKVLHILLLVALSATLHPEETRQNVLPKTKHYLDTNLTITQQIFYTFL